MNLALAHPILRPHVVRAWVAIGARAAMVLLFATFTHAQDSRFLFDANGNLAVQMADSIFPPQITGQPQIQVVQTNEFASFSVVVADPRSLSYQWQFNGSNLPGKTGVSLQIDHVSLSDEGPYRVVLSNPSGSVTSAPAMLWIDNDRDFMGDSWELAHFGNLNQNANSDFDHDGISNIREFQDGTDPTDPNSGRYRLTVIREGGAVLKNPDQTLYDKGQIVTLTVTASSNELFHAWLGSVVSRDNPVTLVMTNDKTVFARFTPIAFTWTSPASGNWEDAANWTPQLAPGLNDSVLINTTVTVTLTTNADCADVTLGNNFTTLTGSGSLIVRANLFWSEGTMSGTGRTILETNAVLNIIPATSIPSLNTRTLENGGTILWGGGLVGIGGGAVITNRPGALFRAENPTSAGLGGGAANGRIDNAGTFLKPTNSGPVTIASGLAFNNYGTVAIETNILICDGGLVNNGTINLSPSTTNQIAAGGSATGTFNVPSGSLVEWNSGAFTLNPGAQLNGAGLYRINFGTLTVNATFAMANLDLLVGTLDGTGTVTVTNAMNWTGGTMSGSGRTIIPAGVTLNAALPGGGNLNARTLENGGTVLWTGAANLGLNSGAVITNRAGALFHVKNAAFLSSGGTGGRIDNAGTFRKSANSGTTTVVSGNFNNSGTVEIQAGTLDLGSGGTHSGSFAVSSGTELKLSGGAHTADGSSIVAGAGRFTVSGGSLTSAGLINVSGSNTFSGGTANFTGNHICTNNTVTISGSGTANFSGIGLVAPAVLNFSNGTLTGTSTVTVNNTMNWTGGTMSGTGRTIIPAGATLNAAVPSTIILSSRTLENGGTVLWTGAGNFGLFSAVITNRAGALFHAQTTATLAFVSGDNHFDNAGTFRKSASSGTLTMGGSGNFNNYGTVDIRSGILAANGGYISSSSALLNCALGGTTAGTGYGQLQVAGAVTLNGALSVDLINGFVPKTNDAFTVLTAGARNGTFANFLFPSNAVTMQLSNTANSVIVRATDVFIVPQPASVPAGLIAWWRAEGNALDSVGTNHGVLTNGIAFAAGQVGQTFALDGADDYVQVPDSPSLRPASVTIEAWVKFFATNGIRVVLGKPLGNNTTFDSYGLALQDGAVLAAICDNSGFGPFLTGPANTVPGQWYYLAYTFDDTSKQQVLYVNGTPVASGIANKTISYDTHPVLLGVDVENGALSFFHNGLIDEASIYNRALTRDEIATIYNAGALGKQLSAVSPPSPLLLPPEISGTNLKLTWTTVSNAIYRVEFKPDLTLSNWNTLPGDVSGISNTASKLDALTSSNRFYRVRVLP